MFDYTYDREIVEGIYNVNASQLYNRIAVAGLPERSVRCDGGTCTVSFFQEISSGQKDLLDTVVAAEKADITILKNTKIAAVHTKTVTEEANGVTYNGHQFSVTTDAKNHWLALVVGKDSLTYPYNVPTGFDYIYAFQDVNDLLAFYVTGMTFMKYWEESNEELVIAIKACTTKEQLDAIVDDRTYPPPVVTTTTTTVV